MSKTKLVEEFELELHNITAALIECGLVIDQHYLHRQVTGNQKNNTQAIVLQCDYWKTTEVGIMASVPYHELHSHLTKHGAFDLMFIDGGLAQMQFEFDMHQHLRRSRLAYLPSPDLTPFQQDPELYFDDELFGNVVDVRTVTTPLRFDYDTRDGTVVDLHHPASHVTFGQYPHCRIAATGPITPYHFIEFIVRAFYRTKSLLLTDKLPGPRLTSPVTITNTEKGLVHFGVPAAKSQKNGTSWIR